MNYPLLRVTLCYALGIILGNGVHLPLPTLFALAFAFVLLALLRRRVRLVLLYPLLVLIGWTNQTYQTTALSPNDLRAILGEQPSIVTIRGTLHETPTLRVFEHDEIESWRTMAQIDVSALCPNREAWRPATGRIAVTTPGALSNYFAGQIVEVSGVARLPQSALAEGTFDYRAYLKNIGIYYQLRALNEQDWQLVSSPPRPPLADRFRGWARKALARGLPVEDESLRLEWVLTLGWKPGLTEEVAEPFVRAATFHIFAVDGLRMAIIFGIFFAISRSFSIPRAIAGAILIPLLWFYVALTGWPASAIRACVMLTVVIVGWVLKRPNNLINSLFAAALIILAWEPQQLYQAGFQLSFFVVLCLVLTIPALQKLIEPLTAPNPLIPYTHQPRWRKLLRAPGIFLRDLLCTSFAAWVGALPLVAYYFNIITPVSTPANLLAVPLCGLVLASNLTSLLFAGWFPLASELFNHAGWFLMECIRVSSHWFANWPVAYAYVSAPSLFTTALYYGILLGIVTGWLFKPELRTWKLSALGCLALLWCGYEYHNFTTTRLTILPTGGSTAIYSDVPGVANNVLIDCGRSNSVQMLLKPFLRAQGLNRLPAFLLTHGDVRQIGGAELVTEIFQVTRICASPARSRSPAYKRILADFQEIPEKVKTISRGDQLSGWAVMHPDQSDHYSRADDNSVVLAREFGGIRVLLLSDLGALGQAALLERHPDFHADIVVSGLPSGSEPLSDELLDSIKPRVIIITDSEFPARQRAPPKLHDRLARLNIPVLYTRSTGAITLELRSGRWQINARDGTRLRGH